MCDEVAIMKHTNTTVKKKSRAPRNRTLICSSSDLENLPTGLLHLSSAASEEAITNRIIHQDYFEVCPYLPGNFVDLLIMDPPYNLTKNYNGQTFRSKQADEYTSWFEGIILSILPHLRPEATVYVCSDWQTSTLVFPVLNKHLIVRNRITWEREKGRGAKNNWKNNTEDIWFCSVGEDYYFNVDAVKMKRRVIAPYRSDDGKPKDWDESQTGNYRLTHPSNLWADITIPFWSMPENTDHPTQKPEKLIAKLILASSRSGDFIFDPFLGSGTSAVVAKKLKRRFCGIEINKEYCCWTAKRLLQAENNSNIQGYSDGYFWERNSLNEQKQLLAPKTAIGTLEMFDE
jgi:site-specific DNA-methyltransferase (adenine-specific)